VEVIQAIARRRSNPQACNKRITTTIVVSPNSSQIAGMAGVLKRLVGAAGTPVWNTVWTINVTLGPSTPGANGFWLKVQVMVDCSGLELHESPVGVPLAAPTALMGIVYAADWPESTVLLAGVGTPKEKSQLPMKLNVSKFVFCFTGSLTKTGTPPLQATAPAGTVAVKLVALAAELVSV
jgi:hypothetical protein